MVLIIGPNVEDAYVYPEPGAWIGNSLGCKIHVSSLVISLLCNFYGTTTAFSQMAFQHKRAGSCEYNNDLEKIEYFSPNILFS